MRAIVVVFGLAAAAAWAAPVLKDFAKKRPDAEVFVGVWDTVQAECNGVPTSKATWTFDAELKMTSVPLGGGGGGSHWVIKLDPTKSPREIDITNYKGIYEFDGADIKIAFTLGGERPTGFDAKPGLYYNLLRRVRDGGK